MGIVNLCLLSRVIWGPTGIVEYRVLKGQLADLRASISNLDAENRALSKDIRLLQSDSQYVEKYVRQRLHYLRDNEVVYIFTEPGHSGGKPNDRKN